MKIRDYLKDIAAHWQRLVPWLVMFLVGVAVGMHIGGM